MQTAAKNNLRSKVQGLVDGRQDAGGPKSEGGVRDKRAHHHGKSVSTWSVLTLYCYLGVRTIC